jgi:hypothetical protein
MLRAAIPAIYDRRDFPARIVGIDHEGDHGRCSDHVAEQLHPLWPKHGAAYPDRRGVAARPRGPLTALASWPCESSRSCTT